MTSRELYESDEFKAVQRMIGVPRIPETTRLTIVVDMLSDQIQILHEYGSGELIDTALPRKKDETMWDDNATDA